MDFTKTELHASAEALARQIFRDRVDDDYHRSRHPPGEGYDAQLWQLLAEAGLVGATVGETYGGSGMNLLEATAVLEAQGAVLAPLPLWQGVVGALLIDGFASQVQREALLPDLAAGRSHFALALAEAARPELESLLAIENNTVTGTVNDVAFARDAAVILLPLRDADATCFYLLDPKRDALQLQLQWASNHEPHYQLCFDQMPLANDRFIRASGDDVDLVEWVLQRAYTALSALQLGVVEEAIRRTAAYVSEREQFNKPLAGFQAVSHRAADGYIDSASLRASVWLAAWRLGSGREATTESRSAKWWACEAGHRTGHTGQHLHGGMGADIEYPIHRYFLWAKQLEYTLGGAQEQLSQLGRALAANDRLGFVI